MKVRFDTRSTTRDGITYADWGGWNASELFEIYAMARLSEIHMELPRDTDHLSERALLASRVRCSCI